MMSPFSKKSQRITSFIAMDILEAAQLLERKGKKIISFALGEPDFNPPQVAKEACIKAIENNNTKYTHSQGLIELREEIAKHYWKNYGVKILPEQVIVTPGTSPAFFLIFSALLEKGDEVILPNPHYPCDANFVEYQDGVVVDLPIYEENGFQWKVSDVKKRITKRTKALFVTSPSNPTGCVLQPQTLKGLAGLGKTIISDEIYHGLIYDGPEETILQYTKNAYVVNGFSKAYAMTGFRLGYLIAPEKSVRTLQKIQQNYFISVNTFVQMAGIAALKKGKNDLSRMKKEFIARRALMAKGLKELGFKISFIPQGAFYFFVNAKHISKNSYELAFDILNKAGVAVTPGIDFGSNGEGYLRFSYATSQENIKEGLARLKEYIKNR